MRILHVIGQRPEMTGSGIYSEALIRESQKHGFSNHSVAGVPHGWTRPAGDESNAGRAYVFFESGALDFPVVGMSDVMPYKSTLFRELKGRRLRAYKAAFADMLQRTVGEFKPDIIHSNHLFLLSALVRSLFPDLPVVATCHGTDMRQYNTCRHLRCFVKHHCRHLDRIIALTADQKRDIVRLYGVPPDTIAVIGGGYDETVFSRAPKPPAGTVHILYAGKFNRSKGVPWLLKSLAKIRHHDWHLHMAGSGRGPECADCMDLADKLGNKVTDHGYVNHHRLSELMKACHVQVLPSFFEGLPLVLFEGLASGCRVITTDLSGFGEIFGKADRETIHRIQLPALETIDTPYLKDEPLLEDALCKSLVDMMAVVRRSPDFDDPHAEKIAADFTWPRVFNRTLKVYNEAITERTGSVSARFSG